jgi:predicted nucleic acid-binding protein
MEYEEVLTRPGKVPISRSAVDAVLDYLCAVGQRQRIFYLWRPKLRDPKDDMVLELAMNAGADTILTHNVRDYVAAQGMGPAIVTPATWLESLRELK